MILRFTALDGYTGRVQDVELVAAPETPIGAVLAALPFPVDDRPCFVGETQLDPRGDFAGSPIVPGCYLTIGRPGPVPRSLPLGACALVRVLDGPDTGRFVVLGDGVHEISRSRSAAFALDDKQVSRRHAEVTFGPDRSATVRDVGSAHGSQLDGVPLTEPMPWAPGSLLRLGDSVLEWEPLGPPARPPVRSPDGRLDFDRAFAPTAEITPAQVTLPQALEQTGSAGRVVALVMALVTPMAMAGVTAYVADQPAYLLIGLFGPIAAGVPFLTERQGRKKRLRRIEQERGQAAETVAATVRTQERMLRASSPDAGELALLAIGQRAGVWPRNARSADGLQLRIGTGTQTAAVQINGQPWPGLPSTLLQGIPITVDLRKTGVLGIVGAPPDTADLTRSLLVQLATLRSPEDLRLVLVTSQDDAELHWATWLPHVDGGESAGIPAWVGNTTDTRRLRIDELRKLVAERLSQTRTGMRPDRWDREVVLVLDGALRLRNIPGMADVLRDGASAGVFTIAADQHGMNEASAECALDAGRITLSRAGAGPRQGWAERIGVEHAEQMARALAPLRDRIVLGGSETAIPYPLRFLDLLDVERPAPADVLARWRSHPGPTTSVVLGADGAGPVSVDLAAQGPHTMLGGATGAGKSILLQTLVTSLLMANAPDELNLVLVDFKGGSAFLPFESCPHVVSLIRSTGDTPAEQFNDAAATRVLASIAAEVRRRESILAPYGGEIDELWRTKGRDGHLPRLVMIFDEFARMMDAAPDFLPALVSVAGKGRSLGMHLVLATQSLQNKLSPEMRNNISLRITLRQNEPADSIAVLDRPDAARIPKRLHGRGMIRALGGDSSEPQLFQSGYLGNPPPIAGAAPARIRCVGWPEIGAARPIEVPRHDGAETDQVLAIRAIEAASAGWAAATPFRPLLPPLPTLLSAGEAAAHSTSVVPASGVVYGLYDAPAQQGQPAAVLDLGGTERLLVAGGPQSGRTTFAETVISGIAERFGPGQAHVYAFERDPGRLNQFADLPLVGGVFSPADPDRIRRFVTWLSAEAERRADQRMTMTAADDPAIVVVIDGWEYFENRADPMSETSLTQTLREIVRSGPPLQIHVVLIGGQDVAASKLSGMFDHRVLLPFPKEETRRTFLEAKMVSPPAVAGRAIDAGNGLHLQVATPDDLIVPAADGALPVAFPPLPRVVTPADLRVDPVPSPTWVGIGLGGPDLAPIGVDLFNGGPNSMLVFGPRSSGRTTALASVIRGLRAAEVGVVVLAPPGSELATKVPDDDGVRLIQDATVKDASLREEIEAFANGLWAVVVDDCDRITVEASTSGPSRLETPTVLSELVAPRARGRAALVVAGDVEPIVAGRRPSWKKVVGEVSASGVRLGLCISTRAYGKLHDLELEPDQLFARPPGRGYLVQDGTTTLVQVATP